MAQSSMADPADEAPLTHSRVPTPLVLDGCRVARFLSRIQAGRDADKAACARAVVRTVAEPNAVQTALQVAWGQRPRVQKGTARPGTSRSPANASARHR